MSGQRPDVHALAAELAAQDRALRGAGLEIWVGAEPTFTLRESESPEWLYEALGGDKASAALRMLELLRRKRPGGAVLRTLGRQYAGEARPRWSLGYYARRDGAPLWTGPPDPLGAGETQPWTDVHRLRDGIASALQRCGWAVAALDAVAEPRLRLVVRTDGRAPRVATGSDSPLLRASVHEQAIPLSGLVDELAARGDRLLCIGPGENGVATIELPAFDAVAEFAACLGAIAEAAGGAELSALVLQGFPPPVDASVAWTTLTPDPAVIEINAAPAADASAFLSSSREWFALARAAGLSAYRLQYNGTVTDSGGGGQVTLGGPGPDASPFFREPRLLPRLIRYFNNHPALSYWFAPDYLGGSSQSPRADEGVRDALLELGVAMEQFEREPDPAPEFIWRSFSPFLTDPSGNPHRSELNIEKLSNPYLPGRGRLGLVEFRALRMMPTPEHAAAVGALLRAVAAMLCREDRTAALIDWGDLLHQRYALPFYLRQDLQAVFDDLAAAGLGPGPAQRQLLLQRPNRAAWSAELDGCRVEVEKALEFWPLVGDVASQERGGSRTVDSSTLRLQVALRPGGAPAEAPAPAGWTLSLDGYRLPLRAEADADGALRLLGLRYRDFVPWAGLHPGIPAQGPLRLLLSHPRGGRALQLELHGWEPGGRPYPGLPRDLEDAAARRSQRLLTRIVEAPAADALRDPPVAACGDYCLDLRRLPRG